MRYKNKDVVPTLEAMQIMIEFYRQKEIDLLKMGFTLTKLANICLHKGTDSKFYPFTESDKDLLKKICKIWSVVPPLSLHSKLWLTRLSTANQRTYASQLST